MAKIPIEILNYSKEFTEEVIECIAIANKLQNSIEYSIINEIEESQLPLLEATEINTGLFFDELNAIRNKIGGFHPYILTICDKPLYANYFNLFGNSRAKKGLGILTSHSVSDIIIPKDKMKAYFLYYLSGYTLRFLNPNHESHKETKNCVYDKKISKRDILKSMRSDAFCEECKKNLLVGDSKITIEILGDLNNLFGESGRILKDYVIPKINHRRKKIFLSYSHKDEEWKNKLRIHLKPIEELGHIDVWSDDEIKPGDDWFDKIKNAIEEYKIGILLISPDFLASDFISHVEIPKLLANVQVEGGKVFPIIVRHSLFARIKRLSRFQAINSPSNPIAGMSESDQDQIFVKIAESIWDLMEDE